MYNPSTLTPIARTLTPVAWALTSIAWAVGFSTIVKSHKKRRFVDFAGNLKFWETPRDAQKSAAN